MDTEIIKNIKTKLIASETPHEASAWAQALKDVMIAIGIQNDLDKKSGNT